MVRSGLGILVAGGLVMMAWLGGAQASSIPAGISKQAVLVVSFGTSVPEARHAVDALVAAARGAFPHAEVRLAFTSNIIRRKILKEQGERIPTPLEALAALQDEGFSSVIVQPTHVIPGEEFDDIAEMVAALGSLQRKYSFSKGIALGKPLLLEGPDCRRMAALLHRKFGTAQDNGMVVFMGHGSPHMADALYSRLQLELDRLAPRYAVGTVEGFPDFDDVMRRARSSGGKRVLLVPLMIVAGDHARNDLAGTEPDSWKSRFEAEGFRVQAALEGLGENPEIQAFFVEHLRHAAQSLEKP